MYVVNRDWPEKAINKKKRLEGYGGGLCPPFGQNRLTIVVYKYTNYRKQNKSWLGE